MSQTVTQDGKRRLETTVSQVRSCSVPDGPHVYLSALTSGGMKSFCTELSGLTPFAGILVLVLRVLEQGQQQRICISSQVGLQC